MTAEDVLRVVSDLERAQVPVWLDGGWGVDALLGEQTRPHSDLDVVVAVEHLDTLVGYLASAGYRITEGRLPGHFALSDPDGRMVDVHPVAFDAAGGGAYTMENGEVWVYPAAGFAGSGLVGGQPVRCLTPEVQLLCHTGYQPDEDDARDVRALAERFRLPLPQGYPAEAT